MKTFPRILAKTAAILAVVIVAGVIFVYSGGHNVAATSGHTKPMEQMLRTMMMRSVVVHARDVRPPADFNAKDRALAAKAAGHYEMMCRTCHGAPGKKPEPWQLYPPAPDLADALRVTRWSDSEVFWITKNGIKDTGMSAFGGSHSDEDLWALTAFIRQLETITPAEYRAMSEHAMAQQKDGAHQPTGRDTQHAPAQPQPPPPHTHKH
jgi:cytochrome c553